MTPPIQGVSQEARDELLHELDGWERAYPLSAFPEPDLEKAAAVLKANGMTLDSISASNMRHVVSCLAPKVRETVEALSLSVEEVRQWHPIDTAPKGGRWIIGLSKRGEVVPVRWGVSWNDQHWANGCVVYDVTHWMPLPEPPVRTLLDKMGGGGDA